jgi:hypothetical protein
LCKKSDHGVHSSGGDQQHVVIGSPHYLAGRRQPLTPADLANHTCLRLRLGGSIYRWQFEKRGEAVSIDIRGPLTLDNPHLILSAATAGLGLAYVSASLARDALADGRIVRVLADWTPSYPGLCFYYPRHRHATAGLRAFVALLAKNRVRCINRCGFDSRPALKPTFVSPACLRRPPCVASSVCSNSRMRCGIPTVFVVRMSACGPQLPRRSTVFESAIRGLAPARLNGRGGSCRPLPDVDRLFLP